MEEFENDILIKEDTTPGLLPGGNAGPIHHFTKPRKNKDDSPPILWPKGRVPFKFATNRFYFTQEEKKEVRRAMKEFHRKTCIKFVNRRRERNFIKIVKVNAWGETDACESYVGRVGGGQEVTLGSWCYRKEVIIHELMHALGFYHEHTKAKSKEFVTIKRHRIQDGMENNFKIHRRHHPVVARSPYDICSIMHYDKSWLVDKNDNDRHCPYPMGDAKTFSKRDLDRLLKMYKCY